MQWSRISDSAMYMHVQGVSRSLGDQLLGYIQPQHLGNISVLRKFSSYVCL